MERNKVTLLFILLALIASVFVGIFTIVSQPNSHSRSQKQKFSKDGLVGAVVIKIEGEIHSGKSTYSSTGSDTILSKLREIESKPEIKGILLEINSPGGTVGASQEIFEELMYLRKDKKIVVSMKDLAASGGYYIAAAADYIYAQHGTITGSIGVITMSPNLSGLLEKANIKMNVYKAGKYKDILSMFREHTKEEELIIDSLLDDTYKSMRCYSRCLQINECSCSNTDISIEDEAQHHHHRQRTPESLSNHSHHSSDKDDVERAL